MDFLILGPIEVRSDAQSAVRVTAPKVVALLALLLVHRNEVVPAEEISDVLWPEKTPPEQSSALRFHVWKLRATLEPDRPSRSDGTAVRRRGPGYCLDLANHTLDADEFGRRVQAARAMLGSRPVDAARLLDEGLALWRGDPMSDVRYEDFVQREIRRLGAMRLDAEILRMEAFLAIGRNAEAIIALETLTVEHPFVEPLWAQLIRALCSDGRRGEALDAYRRARTTMAAELGVEPSAALQHLGRSLLEPERAEPAIRIRGRIHTR